LDVLSESLTLVLTHRLEVVFCGRALVRGHEIGDELPAQIPSMSSQTRAEGS
jgi:hypothetical protein